MRRPFGLLRDVSGDLTSAATRFALLLRAEADRLLRPVAADASG